MAPHTSDGEEGTELQGISDFATKLMVATSLPNSQDSCLNESLNSQLSQIRPESAGAIDLFKGTPGHGTMTPSTSFSNNSSQEGLTRAQVDGNEREIMQNKIEPAHAPGARRPRGPSKASHINRTGAPKRMADGEIKSPGYSLPTSPIDASQPGHSRNSSRTSRSSQIGELSSQLRTRLSYAMIKVQNGWQSHSINELENMASTHASPLSAISDRRRPDESALSNAIPGIHSVPMQSPKRVALAPEDDNASMQSTGVARSHANTRPQYEYPPQEPQQHQVGAAYESFWREHEGGSALRDPAMRTSPTGRPSLAPPVDIVPRNQRRPVSFKRRLPTLHTRDFYSADSPLGSSLTALPTTPPAKRTPKMRTPSQQAAVEKDAVETLVFMSSPVNLGYHPPTTLSGSPLRSKIAPLVDRKAHPDVLAGIGTEVQKSSLPASSLTPRSKPQLSEADIDKMLDDVPDASSSEDDDLLDHLTSKQLLGS